MAKGRSKRSGKAKSDQKPRVEAKSTAPSAGRSKAKDKKLASGLRKQMRRLERQLAEAARLERKRVRKLERAHYRRQMVEAALDELRAATPGKAATSEAGGAVVVSVTPKAAATGVTAGRKPGAGARKPAAAKPAAASAPAAPRTPAARPSAKPARPSAAPAKPE